MSNIRMELLHKIHREVKEIQSVVRGYELYDEERDAILDMLREASATVYAAAKNPVLLKRDGTPIKEQS